MTKSTQVRTLGQAAAVITQVAAVKPRLHEAITDALNGQPRAASIDPSTSSPSWCWTHERPVAACRNQGEMCDGETIRSNDPTGEAAVGHDPARAALAKMARLEKQAVVLAGQLDDLRREWLPTQAELPSAANRAKLASVGEVGCWFCEQAGTWSPPHTKEPTTVGGNLPVARFVCANHYDLIRKRLGRAPSRSENEAFVHHGKWPKIHEPSKKSA